MVQNLSSLLEKVRKKTNSDLFLILYWSCANVVQEYASVIHCVVSKWGRRAVVSIWLEVFLCFTGFKTMTTLTTYGEVSSPSFFPVASLQFLTAG